VGVGAIVAVGRGVEVGRGVALAACVAVLAITVAVGTAVGCTFRPPHARLTMNIKTGKINRLRFFIWVSFYIFTVSVT
jgi:hypothetical protein